MTVDIIAAGLALTVSPYCTHVAVEERKRIVAGVGMAAAVLGGVTASVAAGMSAAAGALAACVLLLAAIWTA